MKTKLALMLNETLNKSLANLVTITLGFFNIPLSVTIPTYLSFLEPASFNEGPNYQLFQFSGHSFILVVFVSSAVIDYYRNSVMRVTVLRELEDG